MTSTMLQVRDLAFAYGSHEVLHGVDLDVMTGTCTCLMGVNGCGKSTLIDCILREHRFETGEVLVDGVDAVTLSARELARRIAYVPQVHERTFPYEVEHIVLMGRTAYASGVGVFSDEDHHVALDALATCGLEHLAQRPYTTLSGGEMQMVLLARELAQNAPLILMDEPTAHLDFKNGLLFLETIESLVRDKGVTVLMATHAPNQIFHMADAGVDTRVAVMDGGRIIADGVPAQVLTEKLLDSVFGIDALVLEVDSPRGTGVVRQIVPQATIEGRHRT